MWYSSNGYESQAAKISEHTMSDQEQDEIIEELRKQIVKIDTEKPSTPQKLDEKKILEKAKEAGETIDDDAIPTDDNNRP